ncbi:nardilysin-like [Arapaima gigas]
MNYGKLMEIDAKEFLVSFGEDMASFPDEASVNPLLKLKECEDPYLSENVDRNCFKHMTHCDFDRPNREVRQLKILPNN